jgi:hypothetical protein
MTSFVRSSCIQRIANRLLLVLLVITLSFAWLPQPAAAQSVQAPSDNLLAAFIIDNTLMVHGLGFTPLQKYKVRIRIADDDPWVKIGKVKANSAGKIHKVFGLTSYFAHSVTLQVCVKDIATGNSRCTTARRAYP